MRAGCAVVVPASGAGAPYGVQRDFRTEEIRADWLVEATPDLMAQTFPS